MTKIYIKPRDHNIKRTTKIDVPLGNKSKFQAIKEIIKFGKLKNVEFTESKIKYMLRRVI